MSTNVRPYFRGGTACRVGALEVHKLKKNDIRKRYAIFLRFYDNSREYLSHASFERDLQ